MTFTPSCMRQVVELPRRAMLLRSARPRRRSTFLSASSSLADVEQALLGEMRDQARVGAVLDDRRRARLASSPPSCGAGSCAASRASAPSDACRAARSYGSQTSTDVFMYSTPWSWHHCRISQQSMFHARSISISPAREMLAEQAPHVLRRDRFWTNFTPCSVQGLSAASSVEVHDRDVLRVDVDVLQQNRQRALRHGAEAHEHDSARKCQHPAPLLSLSFT